MDSRLAVVEEGGGEVSALIRDQSVGAVFGFSDDFSDVVCADDGAADLIVMMGFGCSATRGLVDEAEAVDVVGFAPVWVVFYEEIAVGGGGETGGAAGVCYCAAAAFGIVGVGEACGGGELVTGVVG